MPICLGEQGDRMHKAERQPLGARAVDELKQAAGVRGGHNLRAGGFNMAQFAPQQFAGHFRLREIINAGAAAAP